MDSISSSDNTNLDAGTKLLNAVERMLDADEIILRNARLNWLAAQGNRDIACRMSVADYSNKSAVAGALSSAPGIVPGVGIAATLGMTVLEMAYVLKTEVEMCLSLCAMYDLDIRIRENKQLGFLLAAVQTHEVTIGRNSLLDFGDVSWVRLFSGGELSLRDRSLDPSQSGLGSG